MTFRCELKNTFIGKHRIEILVNFIKSDISHLIADVTNQHSFKRIIGYVEHIAEYDYSAMGSRVLLVRDDEDESQIITDNRPMHLIVF